MIRALKITGIALGAIVLLAVGLAAWLAGTESGSRFALRRAEAVLPPGFDLGTASGRLADRLELAGVTLAGDGFELTIARLRLSWSPGNLLRGRLSIADLGAEGVRYRALPAEEPEAPAEDSEPFALPERFELPVSVHIEHLSVEDVQAVPAPDAEPIEIERVLIEDVAFADARLELAALEIESPLLSAAGRAAVVAADEYPLDVALEWRARPPDYAPLAGETTLGGSLAELEVEQRIAEPYGLTLTGVVRDALDPERLEVTAQLDAEDVRLVDIQPELPDATLGLNARIDGPIDALEVALEASGVDPEQRRFTAELDAVVEPEAVAIRRLAVRQPGRDGVLEGSGRVALAAEVSADLEITWDALQWPLTGEPVVVSPRGTLVFEGPPSGYRLRVDTRLEPTSAPPVDLQLDGEGDMMSAAVTLEAQAPEGTLAGSVDAVWAPSIQVDASLEASSFDPSSFAAGWPGAVDLALEASAQVDGGQVDVTVGRLDAGGTLRDLPLSVAAAGRFVQDGDEYDANIEQLEAALGDTRLEARGRIGERADVEWQLDSEDLASLLPQAAGRVTASGRISGPIPQVRLAADVEGRDLAFDEHRVAILDLRADVDSSGTEASDLALTVRDAEVAGRPVETLTVEAGGTAADHEIRLAVDAEPARGELGVTGRLEDPWAGSRAWQFTLDDGELAYAPLEPWRLAAPASGRVEAERLRLEPQCWQTTDARLCLQGRRDAEGLAADIDVEELRFGYLAAFLPEDIALRGGLSASAQVSQPTDGPLALDAQVTVSESEVTLPSDAAEGGSVTLRIEPSEISAALDESGGRIRAGLNLEHGRVDLQADTVPRADADAEGGAGIPFADHDLDGRLEVTFPDLSFVSQLVPTLEDAEGRLGGALQLAGTVGAPAVTGALELENGSVFVPETAITLTELRARLEGLGRDGIALSASAISGEGELTVDGRMSLPGGTLEARLDIEGDAFEAVNNDDARVFVSPRLAVEADAERVAVTGEVHVPRAELTPGEQPASAVGVSSDQVLVSDEPDAEAAAERDLSAEVRVTLGDDVHFAGFGLTARVEGDLLVIQEPRTPTTATGELRLLDGEYRAYGQGLVIDSGRIYFAGGPIMQPALDVRAVRRPREGILVGANVQGTLESPSFELFSEPSMTQQEQLSWLVLGRSLQEAPEGEGDALSRAALAMGVRGGDFLAQNIGERIGFDQFGIETGSGEAGAPSDPSDAALVVGKYLSPKLYVSYGVGLFTPESVLEMQYEISRNWAFVTQSSGDATGGDVLYTVEFGQN